jgi:hypothetical protein
MALIGATVTGNLAAFHEAATVLESRELPANASEAWRSQLAGMREAAAHATSSTTLEDAARAVGELGAACAACHRALGGPRVEIGRPPPLSTAKARMARHAWAAERMWVGLSAPSDASWTNGANVLADARLEPEVVTSAASVDPQVTVLANRAHAQGHEARRAKDDAARSKALANVYATCAHCHRALGVELWRPQR